MKKVLRIAPLFAILWFSLLAGKVSAQDLPYLDYYVLVEFGPPYQPPGELWVQDEETRILQLFSTGDGGNGMNNSYHALVRYPLERLMFQWPLGEREDIYIDASEPELSPGVVYPITFAGLSSPYLNQDVPAAILYFTGSNGSGTVSLRARLVAPMNPPAPLTVWAKNPHCAGDAIGVNTNNREMPRSDKYVKTSTEWLYQMDGGPWLPLTTSDVYGLNFIPEQYFPEVKTGKHNIRLQCRYKAEYAHATYYSDYSAMTDNIEIMPTAPVLNNSDAIVTTASCETFATGKINVPANSVSSGLSEMRWLLRRGTVTTPCNPTDPTSECGNTVKSSDGKVPVGSAISIEGLSPGDYSLWIINPGEDKGNCFSSYTVTVPQLAKLTISEDNSRHKDLSCYNANDGTIAIAAAGADPNSAYTFTLLLDDVPIIDNWPSAGNSILFEQLSAGTYKVQVKNSSCLTEVATTDDIIIKQPAYISANLVATSPKCTSPGDGSIDILAVATGGTVANYAFNLYRDGTLFRQSGPVANEHFTFTDLPGGNYRAEVLNSGVNCPGWDTIVTLSSLVALTLDIDRVDSIACYGAQDAKLICTAAGGSGAYEYTLLQNNIPVITNTTGTFTDLSAGSYTVDVKNQGTTCDDKVSKNINIFQRSALAITLEQTPISCYGENDALIKAVVNGGSGSYHYQWQLLKNGIWTDNPIALSTDTQIEDLSASTNRLIITDNKASGCSVTSTESIVKAIEELKITNVTLHDAVCLADGAHIEMTGTGGTGALLYEWSLDGGQTYQPFNVTTDITTAGTYKLRLSDEHGCIVDATESYNISLPSAPVSFTRTLSDYGGYNISCKGNNNGFADIIASGGNGGSYNGYTYALDNNPYNNSARVERINAGTHVLYVKDDRGCIVSQPIVMTEAEAVLGLTVTGKEHTGCAADAVGTITVSPEGGAEPYKYAIDGKPWQDAALFTGLVAKEHSLQVRDAAGCITTIKTTLSALYPPLSADADITDASCYGASNGKLQVYVDGGDGNYTYEWTTAGLSGNSAENIAAGDYTLTVTDGKGCKERLTYTVAQPEQLQLKITAPPICDGQGDGSISALVTGGTEPYQYALDHSSWLSQGDFSGLAPGKYNIAIKDAHNCEIDSDATISIANTKPDINFLVASRKNAFDTLVIKDISLPEPNKITWSYDPAAVVLGYDNGTPLIKFTDPGTYWVEMTATFGECTYSLRKELEIGAYDPKAGPAYNVPVHVIDTVTLSPNPNNGYFNFKIKLNRKQKIVAYVYDMNGIVAGKKEYAPAMEVDDTFQIGGTVTGTFILRVITESESKDIRFIISR